MKKIGAFLLIAGYLYTCGISMAHCGGCPGDTKDEKKCCSATGNCCKKTDSDKKECHKHKHNEEDADHQHGQDKDPKVLVASDFTLKDQEGNTVRLSAFKGKKNVVLEWANWDCPFVKPHYNQKTFAKLINRYTGVDKETKKERDVVWLTINSTFYAKSEDHKRFIEAYKLEHAILADPTGKVGCLYKATRTPQMFIINKKGHIVYQGAIDNAPRGNLPEGKKYFNYVDQALRELVAGKEITLPRTEPYGCSVKYTPREKKTPPAEN